MTNNNTYIYLPIHIVENRENIISLKIKIIKNNLEIFLPLDRVDIRVEIDLAHFDDHENLEFHITQKNLDSEIEFKLEAIESFSDLLTPPQALEVTKNCIRNNKSNLFLNTNKGKLECLSRINELIFNTLNSTCIPKGKENLIYFSVYFDEGYVELINNNLLSILKYSTINFDVLIITDEITQNLINQQPFVKQIKPKYHITSTPLDGVEASKNKILIYDYIDIDTYDKILFLDCDIVAMGDIASIFSICDDNEKLYTVTGKNVTFNHHRIFFHGFDVVKQDFILEMTEATQYPFNAGQFIFRNCTKMRKHFSNLKWFMREWPGKYFFEQAFMCYYFCKAKITSNIINNKIALMSTVFNNTCDLQNKILIHFTAPPLNAYKKINFIKDFLHKYNEQFIIK